MTNIEIRGKINPSNLNQNYYVESLLHLAYIHGILSPSNILQLQHKLSSFIEDQCLNFVGGMSCSLPKEKVQSLASSTLYQLSYALQDSTSPEEALLRLQSEPLELLQKMGRFQIHSQVQTGKERLKHIQKERLKLPLQAYQDTLMTGIPLFFSTYDLEYEAHETPGSIDYPLAITIPDYSGIRYINRYLEQIHIENQFCRMFSPTGIHRLLRRFDHQYELNLLNLLEHVYTSALACSLTQSNPLSLTIYPETLNAIKRKLEVLSLDDLTHTLQLAHVRLLDDLNIRNNQLRSLLLRQCQALLPRLDIARQFGTLDQIWIPVKKKTEHPTHPCLDSARLSDQAFRNLSEEIRSCRYLADKLKIIAIHIHNRWDLLELIESHCLSDQEIPIFFQSLQANTLPFLLDSFHDYKNTSWYATLFDIFEKTRHNKQVKKD